MSAWVTVTGPPSAIWVWKCGTTPSTALRTWLPRLPRTLPKRTETNERPLCCAASCTIPSTDPSQRLVLSLRRNTQGFGSGQASLRHPPPSRKYIGTMQQSGRACAASGWKCAPANIPRPARFCLCERRQGSASPPRRTGSANHQ